MTAEQHGGSKASTYDMVLKGGTLLDPGQHIYDRMDVAFKDGKVAAVAERIDPVQAAQIVDVTGKLVTPGFIDLHGHFYHGGAPTGTNADVMCLPAGVTTAIGAGTAGWANYMAMRDYVFPTQKTRLLAFLHIGAAGLLMLPVVGGDLQDMRLVDVDRTADTIKENPGFLLGVKVLMWVDSMPHWEAPNALRQAREAADKAGVKLMVHVSETPIPLPQILELLGPGDIATHIFNGYPEGILDKNGMVRPEVKAAAQRGVVMDVADAGIHCDADIVRAALRQNFPPTTISTDIHDAPPDRVAYRQNDLVSKFHAMGLPLEDAVAASTVRPAKVLGFEKEIGSLDPGMAGDAAVFELKEGRFAWRDMILKASSERRDGPVVWRHEVKHIVEGALRLDTLLTVKDGAVIWRKDRRGCA